MATQKVHPQVALQKFARSYYMYIHLLWLARQANIFAWSLYLKFSLVGIANDAWVPSLFRDDLDFGKGRYGRTNLSTGRIGYTEVIQKRH